MTSTPNSPPPSGLPAPAQRFSPGDWSAFLGAELGVPVEVTFGRARRQVLVARPAGNGWKLRLNAGFGDAPEAVREAVAAWMRSGRRARRASAILDAWIAELGTRLTATPRTLPPLRPSGETHDLGRLFESMCASALDAEERGRLGRPALTWGRSTRRARRSLQLGSYDPELKLIRIHPVLDQPSVPAWFVRFVLFHEALHALQPPRQEGGRTLHHPPEFRARERRHPDQPRADAWQERSIGALLRSARTGRPLRGSTAPRPLAALQRLLFESGPAADERSPRDP